MKYEPTKDMKQAAVADLARSGRWVNIVVFATRIDWGRTRALAVLQSLIRDGLVEMQDVPSKFKGVGAERQYRLRPGAETAEVTGAARVAPKARSGGTDAIVHALVLERGTMTAAEVAEAAKLTRPTARGALARLESAGMLFRYVGPAPATGSQRPWCYEPAVPK